jgi:hypothetical protein
MAMSEPVQVASPSPKELSCPSRGSTDRRTAHFHSSTRIFLDFCIFRYLNIDIFAAGNRIAATSRSDGTLTKLHYGGLTTLKSSIPQNARMRAAPASPLTSGVMRPDSARPRARGRGGMPA